MGALGMALCLSEPRFLHEEQRQLCLPNLPHKLLQVPSKDPAMDVGGKNGTAVHLWVIKTKIHQQEGEAIVPRRFQKRFQTSEQAYARCPAGLGWSGAPRTRPNARLSFSLLTSGNVLRPPHITLISRVSVLRHFVSKQLFARAWVQRWPGADLKWSPVPNAHSPVPLYMSWHWPQTGFCQKLPEKVAFHSSWLKGSLDDKYLPHLITETVSKPVEED